MPKRSPSDLTTRIRRSIGKPLPEKPQRRKHLAFANAYLEQLFRALAAVHPKGVLINDVGWQAVADELVRMGLFSCAINRGRTYRLTSQGIRRAVEKRVMKTPANG